MAGILYPAPLSYKSDKVLPALSLSSTIFGFPPPRRDDPSDKVLSATSTESSPRRGDDGRAINPPDRQFAPVRSSPKSFEY